MAFVKGVAILAVALSLIMLMSYWAAGRARLPLDAEARTALLSEGLAHNFIDLADGTVHYRLEGPDAAPTIVLIHGFSVPSFVWNDHIAPLTQAGYRVLAYDTYGRGYSDRPNTTYDAELMDRQLAELLAALKIDRRIDLVGYSMGGAIATIFTARHPELVRSLTLIAPAGLGVAMDERVEILKKPLIGDWIIRLFGTRLFYSAASEAMQYAPNPGSFLADFSRQLDYRGFGDALLSTLRHYPLTGADASFAKVGRSSHPILAIWGEADTTVPYTHAAKLIELMPQAQFRSYPATGHNITFERPDLVTDLIIGFLRVQDAKLTSSGMGGKPRGPLTRMEARQCDGCSHDQEGVDSGSTAPSPPE